jgi:dTDP-4-dehydrorhamnose 3,5-epimerase
MKVSTTEFEGLLLIEPAVFKDQRGVFFESFNQLHLKKYIPFNFLQDNVSVSAKNVVRGLHFQIPPYAQGKLVCVLNGAVVDIVVDIRKASSTYGQTYSLELSAENRRMLYVPPGFAHGFVSLEEGTIFSYKCTNVYNKDAEGGILFNDPFLKINWRTSNPIVSEKDLLLPCFIELNSVF